MDRSEASNQCCRIASAIGPSQSSTSAYMVGLASNRNNPDVILEEEIRFLLSLVLYRILVSGAFKIASPEGWCLAQKTSSDAEAFWRRQGRLIYTDTIHFCGHCRPQLRTMPI